MGAASCRLASPSSTVSVSVRASAIAWPRQGSAARPDSGQLEKIVAVRACTTASVMVDLRTAIRIQSASRPGKVSPRRTAKPLSRSASRNQPGSRPRADRSGVDQHEGRPGRGDRWQPDLGESSDQVGPIPADLLGGFGGDGQRGTGSGRPQLRPAPGWRPTTAAAGPAASAIGRRVADGIAGPQTRPSPRSWSVTADTSMPVIGPPISDSASPGTASMKASSTTSSRPGLISAVSSRARVQHAGRVGRVADHDQIGVIRDQLGVRAGSRPRRDQQHPVRAVAGGDQRRLRLGELRVDDHRPPPRLGAGQQGEGFRPARGRQHLIAGDLVGGGDGRRRRPRPAGRRRVAPTLSVITPASQSGGAPTRTLTARSISPSAMSRSP